MVWWCWALFRFCLSVKLLISQKPCWVEYSWLQIFLFHHFKYIMSLPSGLWSFFAEKSADRLMGVLLYIPCCFPLAAFNILSLSLIFAILMTMCLGVVFFGLILFGALCAFWAWISVSFPKLGKFSVIMSSNMFSAPYSLSSPSGTSIMWILVHLMLSHQSLKTVFISVFSFLFSAQLQWFPLLFQLAEPFLCII